MDFIDFYHDPEQTIMGSIENAPPFLVGHRAMTDKELEGLSLREFADPNSRQFPIASRAETWRSIAYFNHQAQTLVAKQALLSPESAAEREKTRQLLAKAAQLWDLDDDEVVKLSEHVNLGLHTAEAEEVTPGPGITFNGQFVPVTGTTAPDTAADFLQHAPKMDRGVCRDTAGALLKAAESVGAELPLETKHELQVRAGEGTCTAGEAATILFKAVPHIPHKAEIHDTLSRLRTALDLTPPSRVLKKASVDRIAALLQKAGDHFVVPHVAESLEALRTITPAVLMSGVGAVRDTVKLPGGIRASKAKITSNASYLSTWLANTHKAEAHKPDDIVTELQKLTPVDLLPLREHIGG